MGNYNASDFVKTGDIEGKKGSMTAISADLN